MSEEESIGERSFGVYFKPNVTKTIQKYSEWDFPNKAFHVDLM